MLVVGVDTGGTFTDLIVHAGEGEAGRFVAVKVPSTPDDPARAILEGLERLKDMGLPVPDRVVHGSTVATNAVLERKGAKTALVATRGFSDVIAIGRQNRTDLYDPAYRRAPCIVPDALRFEAPGRVLADKSRREILSSDAARTIAARVAASGAESVAVCLLFSFLDPADERLLGRELAARGLAVSLSHEIMREFREFERTSTTAVNAYVSPLMARYLTRLHGGLGKNAGLCVMQSSGGIITASTAMRQSVRTILSGPAGGVTAAMAVARETGYDRLITFDMGGTSTDVALLDKSPVMTTETVVSGYPVTIPMIDIHTVGAGGGSLAAFDAAGALTVGPRSAGADPGPACYGRGEGLTVTDANLVLGRIVPEMFLGGGMPLFPDRAMKLMTDMAALRGMDALELAEGIVAVAEAAMERAIRVISVERGHDPAEFALVCFGGAGGLHAVSLARSLGMRRVVVPPHPGLFSALGMLLADISRDFSATVMLEWDQASAEVIEARFSAMEERAGRELETEGAAPGDVELERSVDMRYRGQSFELNVPFCPDMVAAFNDLHEKTYGYKTPGRPVQCVTLRVRATARTDKPGLPRDDALPGQGLSPPVEGQRAIFHQGRHLSCALYARNRFVPGHAFAGPAVVAEDSATSYLPPGTSALVDALGNLVIDTGERP
ncbi:hydantoinase/oxoprolinase family protein [Desulfolutivibrio sulfoxidireducens]|uniref:hydantoinase/oxoprolinase family protein n=1 Tax=Desulfolutivibrio sulfoxidireducens TaxID=2773299 RepID=UPI00159E1813|nr:hydantoinase/oxoprolinase family protein [Desulfolutivibrio sulfoxidireducens]QLA19637.1 hydantoinase/oxoprolinase family protein [Desulfolutivibrio sulfoxidireducens]